MRRVIDGGSERYMSSLNAIMAYIDEGDDTYSVTLEIPFLTS